ncbi:hypothetical protein D0T50_06945 [Bacteroides sp. 214]|uniref:hypothetical protein n=1 Tax=Bacteroides sp. 214 TaxID=2302935 RepID=UPI0013D517B0|nr:hypothetical protein [Bacteroides sp. 214]NDW12625.1 hypothetical protein [Bacteroides sp. 214]
MKLFLDKFLEVVALVLPFLRKKDAKQVKEFSELVSGQYEFLVTQLERVLKDYFELSDRVKEMHTEIFGLRKELSEAMKERCTESTCAQRK